jgi:hypothetical protein
VDAFIRDVKYNCDVSDAHFWGSFSLCGLLMRMRGLYRDDRRLRPWEPINHEEILEWISVKEECWNALQGQSYRPLPISSSVCDPFDVIAINREIEADALVYGAGYGLYMKPTFFVGALRSRRVVRGYTAYLVGREEARDIFTSAGLLQGRQIFVRLDALRTSLWEMFLEAQGKNNRAVMGAFQRFRVMPGMDYDEEFESRFEALTEHYAESVLLHELAEAQEDVPGWSDALSQCGDRRTEYLLRQVKDAIADSSDHGPLRSLIDRRDAAGLTLYLESLSAYHTKRCPQLWDAFTASLRAGDWEAMDGARQALHDRFTGVRDRILSSHCTCAAHDEFIADMREIERSLSAGS